MKISVIGTGYVGLVTGSIFAHLGHDVICMDIDEEKVKKLKSGDPVIYEPGLEDLLKEGIEKDKLHFTTDIKEAVEKSDFIFICVGTPPKKSWETDLSYVKKVAEDIGKHINGYKIVVTKSTVPVGTGNMVKEIIRSYNKNNHPFDIVSNPEFLREGSAVEDTLHPDRIVVGSDNKEAAQKVADLYRGIDAPVLIVKLYSSELIKYASNSFLATKISFINSIADICERTGADVEEVAKGMGMDKRIGYHFLKAGLGYGGSCFPKDVDSILYTSMQLNEPFIILEATRKVNENRPVRFVERMEKMMGELRDKKIAIWGLAFKPNTDDMREAVSIKIIKLLKEKGSNVIAYDPVAMNNAKNVYLKDVDIEYVNSPMEAVKDVDALVLVTEWDEFKRIDMKEVIELMKGKFLFDGRNLYNPEEMEKIGFSYVSIGR